MTYRAMRNKLKSIEKHEITKDGIILDGVNYNASYKYTWSRETFIRSTILIVVLLILFVALGAFFWNELEAISESSKAKYLFFLFFTFMMDLVILYSLYTSIISIRKLNFEYDKGSVLFNDGFRIYEFRVKRITSIGLFYYSYRSSKWRLKIRVLGKEQPIFLDIMKYEEPEIIYRLLTNFNDKVKIY